MRQLAGQKRRHSYRKRSAMEVSAYHRRRRRLGRSWFKSASWPIVGRVILFSLATLVVLAGINPWTHAYTGYTKVLFVGAIASALNLLLTWLFVRWDGGSLRGVGAVPSRGSPDRKSVV